MKRRPVNRVLAWKNALSAVHYDVTHVNENDGQRYIWIDAKSKRPEDFRPYLSITDAWDDSNEAWSRGFGLGQTAAEAREECDVSYDGARVDICWLCQMIEARR